MRKLRPLLTLVIIASLLWFWQGPGGAGRIDEALDRSGAIEALPSQAPAQDAASPGSEAPTAAPTAFSDDGLPPEALETLALIARDGPYPHRQDGSVFNNFERRLPARPRGYYREFTVRTPGLSHRGPRRIVTGGQPPAEYWYTDDHYESFRRIGARR
ncbi:ribonuclease domain-containing protein [Arenimonas sp.]|uniref:ribonuclease domain-containing protein n=1 Tax=Arenimonas sp. TaxID=1872635 RepID=UPI002E329914|nr:ribonuclease domain-containing protein [Arenimonas sp.]HEX4853662.1 ribonuclease domain-containing protein [Arenimonas sp.]